MKLGVWAAGAVAAVTLASCGPVEPAVALPPSAIGAAVAAGDIEYTITSVETAESVSNNPYISGRAAEGGVLVVVKYSVKNAGTKPMEFYDKAKMHLVDPAGIEYSSDSELTTTYQMQADLSDKMFADLNPGITTRGADVYEVAASAFDPATWQIKIAGAATNVALQ